MAWAGVLLHPARPWDMHPVDADDPATPHPDPWPSVGVIVPARNERLLIGGTLHGLMAQDYPGPLRIVVVDDRSDDGTADVARATAAGSPRPVDVVPGQALPDGWVGKVWAMQQGVRRLARDGAAPPEWILLTDADIRHTPDSLRLLVGDAVHRGVALNSRMARLRCRSVAERLLIPPFVLFFFLLYPLRWANRAGSRMASAAGGCILVRSDALEAGGGLQAVSGALIDDLALARRVKRHGGGATRLALSRDRVRSERAYDDLGSVWDMVRRCAFTQLNRSWLVLIGVLVVMLLMFAGPPVALVAGIAGVATGGGPWASVALATGALAWAAMAVASGPVTREFGLGSAWRMALPVSGLIYGAMTLDSALRGPRGDGWR